MTQREKTLAIAVAALAVIAGLWMGVSRYVGALESRSERVGRAEEAALDEENEVIKARGSLARLAKIERLSLPTDPAVARSAYTSWLIGALRESGLVLVDVKFAGERRVPGAYVALSFSANASGDLESVVRLLDAYYRLPVLHQVTQLQLGPGEDSSTLRMTLASTALVVEGARRKELATEGADTRRLDLPNAQDYVAAIVGRDPFAPYTPPPPPPPPPRPAQPSAPRPKPPEFDDSRHAYLTGVVSTGSRLQAWINVRTTGEVLRVEADDPLKVGLLEGRVVRVEPRGLVFEVEGQERRIPLGSPLEGG